MPSLFQKQNGLRGERLGHRAEAKQGVGPDRLPPFEIRKAIPALVDCLAIPDNCHSDSRPIRWHAPLYDLVNYATRHALTLSLSIPAATRLQSSQRVTDCMRARDLR